MTRQEEKEMKRIVMVQRKLKVSKKGMMGTRRRRRRRNRLKWHLLRLKRSVVVLHPPLTNQFVANLSAVVVVVVMVPFNDNNKIMRRKMRAKPQCTSPRFTKL